MRDLYTRMDVCTMELFTWLSLTIAKVDKIQRQIVSSRDDCAP